MADEARRQGTSVDAIPEQLLNERAALRHLLKPGSTRRFGVLVASVPSTGAISATIPVEQGIVDMNAMRPTTCA
jgi:hypothetical protein